MDGKELKALRDKRCLSQSQFKKKIGYSIAQISRWENGKLPISKRAELWIKNCLGVKEDE